MKPSAQEESPKPLAIADLDDDVRQDATDDESTPGMIRTCDLRIRSQHATPENPEENAHSPGGAAPGAAVDPENGPVDPDLRLVVERWGELSEPVKAGILAMVRAADESVIAHCPGKKLQ